MKKTTVIIDTDTGIDDALAIALAVSSPVLDIKMISAMYGNVEVEQAAKNALRLIDLFRAEKRGIVVARGCAKPITPEKTETYHAHGADGLGGMQFETDKYTSANLSEFAETGGIEESYFEMLSKLDRATVIEIAPMTNLAKFVTKYPEFARKKIERIVFMGGSLVPNPFAGGDYQIPYAEFNVNIDPDAVKIVLASGIPLTMVPMELGHTAYLTPSEIEKGRRISGVGQVFCGIFPHYMDRHVMQPNIATHDMTAVCALTNPELIKFRPANLSVVSNKQKQAAIEVSYDKPPNATAAAEIDVQKFRKLYLTMLRYYK
jgi:non-specific riboncleoside hydrolase